MPRPTRFYKLTGTNFDRGVTFRMAVEAVDATEAVSIADQLRAEAGLLRANRWVTVEADRV